MLEIEIDPVNAQKWIDEGALIIDVREPIEWIAGHAPDVTHIPLGFVEQNLANLPRDQKVIVICRSGKRSLQATLAMREVGVNAYNLAGGMQAWQSAGLPVIAQGGEPGAVI